MFTSIFLHIFNIRFTRTHLCQYIRAVLEFFSISNILIFTFWISHEI